MTAPNITDDRDNALRYQRAKAGALEGYWAMNALGAITDERVKAYIRSIETVAEALDLFIKDDDLREFLAMVLDYERQSAAHIDTGERLCTEDFPAPAQRDMT